MNQPKDYYESERVDVISNLKDIEAIREELDDRAWRNLVGGFAVGAAIAAGLITIFYYMLRG